MVLLQLLINGLIAGAIYALVASGFSLIYSVCKFVHLAHGATILAAGYFLYFLYAVLEINFWLSAIAAVGFAGAFGWLLNKLVYAQLRERKASNAILLIASFVLLILFESLVSLFFGADVKTLRFIKIEKGIEVFDAVITPLQVAIIATAFALFALLFFFLKKTKTGKALRAVADNKQAAEIVGISSNKVYGLAFLLGSAIAGAAAVLIGLEQNLEPTMGMNLVIKGFTGAVVGGIDSVPGAILGAFLLGFVENVGIWFLPSGYKDAIAFVVLFAFLLFKPQGILGVKKIGAA
ncbi:branched-chain amino acid ABC transporter permease [Candidatus Micrarchaeota archaeon]|nr:branched-chain amino acid ABC transporter permease [Candidatus Micrarchaeota archaeon]